VEGTVDFRVGGTFERPTFVGSLDLTGGEYLFLGNRLYVRQGSVEFRNPDKFEPIFDLAAETRVRANTQIYNINLQVAGTLDHITYQLSSDPPLPESDIISLLFGGVPKLDTAEQRALGSPQESQQRAMQSAMATLLASPLSSRVGQVVEKYTNIDTVQITPLLSGDVAFQQLNTSARVTLGQRITQRVFLTYSRTVGISAAQDEIILLEYEQNDRVSWILSRNEDRSFALDFRIRYSR
jgi:autotransporter translocation and assembly factor TamB